MARTAHLSLPVEQWLRSDIPMSEDGTSERQTVLSLNKSGTLLQVILSCPNFSDVKNTLFFKGRGNVGNQPRNVQSPSQAQRALLATRVSAVLQSRDSWKSQ